MLSFLANARDGSAGGGNGCAVCCCQPASARPGETNKWIINYHDWVAPIRGRGIVSIPSFQFELITPCPAPNPANRPPTNVDYFPTVTFDTPLTANVSASADDPEDQPLTFALLPIYGPTHGKVSFNSDGSYTYTPNAGYSGYDAFWFTTSDAVNLPVVNKVTLRVNPQSPAPALPTPAAQPHVWIDPMRVGLRSPIVEFPVVVSPAARPGDLWRITVLQSAIDCEGICFSTVDCFDLLIGKC